MTLGEALCSAAHALAAVSGEDAHFEAKLLLQHILAVSTAQLYSEPERVLTSEKVEAFRQLIRRRLRREPVSYILGSCEFYGNEFCVDSRAFIPRPETELLVEKAVEFSCSYLDDATPPSRRPILIADVGTGTGAIAISLALALPQVKIYATDISASAIEVAKLNCERHNVSNQVILLQGNLLEPLPEPVDLIVANLPYIEDSELAKLSSEISNFEPLLALAGGEDGLDKMRQLLGQASGKIYPDGCIFLEVGQGQAEALTPLVSSYFPEASVKLASDLSEISRLAKITLPASS